MNRHPVEYQEATVVAQIKKGMSITEALQKSTAYKPQVVKSLENEFVKIYSWVVDFFRLQPNDYFKIIYELKVVKGEPVSVEKIKAAYFSHNKRDYYAFYFPIQKGQDYYDEKGNSLKRFFLSAPIEYTRISSGYTSRRFHPVQKVWKAHLGTDYAAPTGTPIWTTADGTVTEAGFTAGNGLYVKIYHNKTYQTQYLHMSRIAKGIQVGKRVKQGEIIGYVGSTGLASGPHVCYRFWKNGVQIDGRKERFTAQNSNNVAANPLFLQIKENLTQTLDSLTIASYKEIKER